MLVEQIHASTIWRNPPPLASFSGNDNGQRNSVSVRPPKPGGARLSQAQHAPIEESVVILAHYRKFNLLRLGTAALRGLELPHAFFKEPVGFGLALC
jgi:hypothetical protein